MRHSTSGFSLLEIVLILVVLSLLVAAFVPLASGFMDVKKANGEMDELRGIHTAIVGDPGLNTFGYLGDVGAFPAELLDLVRTPASNPAGWNGPYITDVRIDNGILYDQFGGAIEFFQPNLPNPPTLRKDQFTLISKGPDRTSTNTAANPNKKTPFVAPLPSAAGYGSTAGNFDNIAFPMVLDNVNLVNYQSLGQVVFNIYNYDDNAAMNDFAPGCPGMYDIIISSLTHPTASHPNEAYMTYAPGGAYVDLLQGTYLVKVVVTGSSFAVWQEQITVEPGQKLTRNLWLPGVNSSTLLATINLTVTNNSAVVLQAQQYGVNVGATFATGGGTGARAMRRCSRITIQNVTSAGNPVIDSFIMPNFAYPRRYATVPTLYTLTVSNSTINTVAIYDEGILLGTVGMRSDLRVKSFTIKSGNIVSIRDDTNIDVEPPFTMSGDTSKDY